MANQYTAIPEGAFRTPTACRLTGTSYRQLDYWAQTRLVPPSIRRANGSGSFRLYSFADLVNLKLVKNLIDAGISLQRVREAVDFSRARFGELGSLTIVSDGVSLYATESPDELYDLMRGGRGIFGISTRPIIEELAKAVEALEAERT